MIPSANFNNQVTVNQFLKNRILWRIYLLWFLRRIMPLIVLQVAVFALVVRIFARSVYISMVFQNSAVVAASSYWAVLKYLFVSFLNTRPLIQAAILVILGVLSLLFRDLAKALFAYKAMWLRK